MHIMPLAIYGLGGVHTHAYRHPAQKWFQEPVAPPGLIINNKITKLCTQPNFVSKQYLPDT